MKNIYTRINAIEKNISNRINTIELGEHDVKLSLLSELQKLNAESKIHLVAFRKAQVELKNTAKIVVASGENFQSNVRDVNDIARKISESFKELGLNYQDNADIKEAQKILNENSDVADYVIYTRQIVSK